MEEERSKQTVARVVRHQRWLRTVTLILWGCLLLVVTQTTPNDIGPTGITGFFILLGIAIYTTILQFQTNTSSVHARRYAYSALLAGVVVTVIALSSLGQLSLRDLFFLILLLVLGRLYFSYQK